MEINPKLYKELDFDQFSRYYYAKKEVDKTRKRGEKLKILDVGGYRGSTRNFLPKDDVSILDVYNVENQVEGYKKGSALNIPYKDSSFDAVVSFDVYEHIKQKDREKYLNELIRVSRKIIIITAPYNSPSNSKAEETINAFFKKLTNNNHPWLKEHIQNGLPEIDLIRNVAEDTDVSISEINTNNINLWVLLQSYNILMSYLGTTNQLRKINEFYNSHLEEIEDVNESDTYRKIFILNKTKTNKSSVENIKQNTSNGYIMKKNLELTLENKIFLALNEIILKNRTEQERASKEIIKLNDKLEKITYELSNMKNSRSWRMTSPLRRKSKKNT